MTYKFKSIHCVEVIYLTTFCAYSSCSTFSSNFRDKVLIKCKYYNSDILLIQHSVNSVQIQENMDQKKSPFSDTFHGVHAGHTALKMKKSLMENFSFCAVGKAILRNTIYLSKFIGSVTF